MRHVILCAAIYLGSVMTGVALGYEGAACQGRYSDMSRALQTAYDHFNESLSLMDGNHEGRPLRAFLSQIENYEIRIASEGAHYIIKFLPATYPQGSIRGGGAGYKVRKCTLEIDDVEGYM